MSTMVRITKIFADSPPGRYTRAIRSAPREIFNARLFLSAALYATAAIPLTWDQGAASVVPSLRSFQRHFGIASGTDAGAIRNFVSLVYLGDAGGAAFSFFINDRLGRLWSFRLYCAVWIVGQLIAIFAPNVAGLYAARIVCGLGIGALSATGPMSLVEIAPPEIRGLLASWYSVFMGLALMTSTLCVLGVELHIPSTTRLQYQVVWFSPCIYIFLWILVSFFCCESPRWLMLRDRYSEAVETLVSLRGLPAHHPRVQQEIQAIRQSIHPDTEFTSDRPHPDGFVSIVRETFTVPSNLRRVQQALISYALPQLSGGNIVTTYLIPILTAAGLGGSSVHNLTLQGLYTMSKFFFALLCSFFFIDALGRRKSLFVGATFQGLTDIYLAVYIKVQQDDNNSISESASQAALAAIFLHAFGYAVGLLTLPYVFGSELWPNRIRSFGSSLSQTFHWLFHYAMTFGLPSLLARTSNWGAFVFFACWCTIAIIYVYFVVPEISGLSVEEIEDVFRGPWYRAYQRTKPVSHGEGNIPRVDGREVFHEDGLGKDIKSEHENYGEIVKEEVAKNV